VGGWIASYVFIFIFWSRCCCCCCLLLLLPTTSVLKRREMLARSDSPVSRGPCPRAGPPSPRPSRSASEVARSRLRGLPHAPYVFARTPVPIYCYLLLLLGLLPYLLPSNRLIILYSYHYTYHVLLVITILLLVVGYILQKHVVYVYTGPNTSIRTCSAIHHGWLCVPCEIADDKGSGLFLSLSYCYS